MKDIADFIKEYEEKNKFPDLSYLCPHCKSKKEPLKRYGGFESEKEIYTCVDCTHQFEGYELHAKQDCDRIDYMNNLSEAKFKEGYITADEMVEEIKKSYGCYDL